MSGEHVDGDLQVTQDGAVLTVLFSRPEQRNAMTFAMYEGLHEACERADADDAVRVLVLRGAGRAFVAGTDISQFLEFTGGDDGVAYEQGIERVVTRLEDVTVPTVAAVDGACVGGGLALAAACDLRLATPSSRFGVPVARTLGNCLSVNSVSLLVQHLGPARTLDLLLRARLLGADEAAAAGFVTTCPDGGLDAALEELTATLVGHAPLSMWAAKQAVVRLRRAGLPDDTDLVRTVYGSADFRAGVAAFVARERVSWTGR
ncbi:Enoyl-CoA hydratase/carnithine racemase [Geodermatophilus pulveris]|uniref:Enoyl-CoA hydratase/carnithine racemase n=1 Tax=Geodermatophilus pulveris TaxID=1564159 RepID=A0A239I4V0_9ACTN|nr:enoyl-CoA hydratase [Geodermatophilus pulveris]SNS87354.1 Enoyl-CoA hydratase/carnithine racemase [Geodermatophilus pulveris]